MLNFLIDVVISIQISEIRESCAVPIMISDKYYKTPNLMMYYYALCHFFDEPKIKSPF